MRLPRWLNLWLDFISLYPSRVRLAWAASGMTDARLAEVRTWTEDRLNKAAEQHALAAPGTRAADEAYIVVLSYAYALTIANREAERRKRNAP